MQKIDGRKEKRAMRKLGMDDKVYEAYMLGQYHSASDVGVRHYPKGRRAEYYQYGMEVAREMDEYGFVG